MSSADKQIEEILDNETDEEREKDEFDLIVQVETGIGKTCEGMLERAAEAVINRRMLADPREIVPKVRDAFAKAGGTTKLTKKLRMTFGGFPSSLAAQTALVPMRQAASKIQQQTMDAFKALKDHDSVKTYFAREEDSGTLFETSGASRVKLNRAEVDKLRSANLATVHRNRHMKVPPINKAARLPENLKDSFGSAWGVCACGALSAWGAFAARGAGVKVGVLDTGVDDTHPDLAGKVVDFAEFNASGQVVSNQPRDSHNHGTHVCGTVCGGNSSGRWIGVAPEAQLAVGLVLNGDQGGTDAQILAGIDWALRVAKVDVMNMSLGGLSLSPIVQTTYEVAILNCLLAGVPVVTAIGNDGHQTTGAPGSDFLAYAVGAIDVTDTVAGFSGGRTQQLQASNVIPPQYLPLTYSKPEISAPGVAVLSSIPSESGELYAAFNGTSMATPHVSGAMALLLSATNKLSNVANDQRAFLIQDLLSGSVEELGESGQDHRYGFGRLDILRAIGMATEQGF